jgi:hypothetical protein
LIFCYIVSGTHPLIERDSRGRLFLLVISRSNIDCKRKLVMLGYSSNWKNKSSWHRSISVKKASDRLAGATDKLEPDPEPTPTGEKGKKKGKKKKKRRKKEWKKNPGKEKRKTRCILRHVQGRASPTPPKVIAYLFKLEALARVVIVCLGRLVVGPSPTTCLPIINHCCQCLSLHHTNHHHSEKILSPLHSITPPPISRLQPSERESQPPVPPGSPPG